MKKDALKYCWDEQNKQTMFYRGTCILIIANTCITLHEFICKFLKFTKFVQKQKTILIFPVIDLNPNLDASNLSHLWVILNTNCTWFAGDSTREIPQCSRTLLADRITQVPQ